VVHTPFMATLIGRGVSTIVRCFKVSEVQAYG
jgi:hypothetical protein